MSVEHLFFLTIAVFMVAFLGGYINLPTHLFKILVGFVLLFSAVRFLFMMRLMLASKKSSIFQRLYSGGERCQ